LDDQESWPRAGNLNIDGFVYGRIARGPTDAEARLQWLALQAEFTPQPYRQLAKVLRELGDDQGARRVLYKMEKLRRTEQSRIWRDRLHDVKLTRWSRLTGWTRYWLARGGGWVLKATIGYGFRLQWTLYCILVLTILGAVIFHCGYQAGAMTPVDEKAYFYFQQHHEPPPYQQQFMCIAYSLENTVPVLKFGQDSTWTPDPAPQSAGRWWRTWPIFLRFFRRTEIVCGWLLATLFIAGVTGVVRKEQV
jgi:hypothetical protein